MNSSRFAVLGLARGSMTMEILCGDFPDLPDAYLVEIGRVSVRWSMLETMLHFALIKFAGMNVLEGRSHAIFHHMAFPQKIDILGTMLSEMVVSPVSQTLREKYAKDVKPLLDEAQRKRNDLIHAKWGMESGQVSKSKISARGALKFSVTPISVEEIREASDVIYQATLAIASLTPSTSIKSDPSHSG
jgi:hypothetical protein